ncbi:MAG: hypothetical protein JJU19_11710 [Pararhodobacter sp.]|nr:hypothetical protein [Pararhodobacter sp.]
MTALTRYSRLEGSGIWRPHAGAQRRDVAVVLGKASLTLLDSRTGGVLAHWSLPAVERLNPGRRPALFSPGGAGNAPPGKRVGTSSDQQDTAPAGGETLELDDELLVDALEAIHRALRPPERRRWLRRGVGIGTLALVALVAVLWLPPALVDHTAGIVPQASRAQIARATVDTLPSSFPGSQVCAHPGGRQALATLRARILGGSYRALVISGIPGFEAAHLPGQVILLGDELLTRLDAPEALAGYLIAEAIVAEQRDPLREVLRHAGFRATLTLLTTGRLPDDALDGYLTRRLAAPPARPPADALVAALGELGVSPLPYASALGNTGEMTGLADALADARIAPGDNGAGRLIGDGEWLMLQSVCDN